MDHREASGRRTALIDTGAAARTHQAGGGGTTQTKHGTQTAHAMNERSIGWTNTTPNVAA